MQDWIEERYGDQDDFDFYPVNVAENEDHVAEYVEQIGLEIPVLLVTRQVNQQYLLRGRSSPYPLDYIIDTEGIIQYAQHEYEPELMLETIDRLLDMDENQVPDGNGQPFGFTLYSNYPNPFNSTTTISYQLSQTGQVTLSVYDLNGKLVSTLFYGVQSVGSHQFAWDALRVPSGVYLMMLSNDQITQTSKVLLLR